MCENERVCKVCGENKSLEGFCLSKKSLLGRRLVCKQCVNKNSLQYRRTKYGLLYNIYRNQINNSRKRGMSPPDYTSKEFIRRYISDNRFICLREDRVLSGYIKNKTPSFDRIDDYESYTYNNLEIKTWGENFNKGMNDIKSGKNNKKSRRIRQYTKDGEFIKEHFSISSASREVGGYNQNICKCLSGEKKTAYGFVWKGDLFNN